MAAATHDATEVLRARGTIANVMPDVRQPRQITSGSVDRKAFGRTGQIEQVVMPILAGRDSEHACRRFYPDDRCIKRPSEERRKTASSRSEIEDPWVRTVSKE
jgi:hypothetical protein